MLLLQGKKEEAGTYSCRQTNRLIARTAEKIFIVSSDDIKDVTVIAVSIAVVVLFLIGIAAGVLLYTFKVSDNEKIPMVWDEIIYNRQFIYPSISNSLATERKKKSFLLHFKDF